MVTIARTTVLTNYLEVAQHLGINTYNLLLQVGLNPAQLKDSKQQIPVDRAIALLEESALISNCETLGLRMAEQRQLSDFGEVSLLLSYQHTLRDALQVMVQYRHLLNNALAIYIEEVGNTVIIREEVVTQNSGYSRQATELAIGVMYRFCSALLGANWRPQSVRFTHNAPADLAVHRRIFGHSLEFGSEFNGIVCTAAEMDIANPHANPAMAEHAQRYLETLQSEKNSSVIFDVRKSIYLLLPMGRATIEQVASAHGINVRTLQRRLDESQASFSNIINDVRRDLVIRYLNNPSYSLGQIADILGYSMPSSFTRWFISQFHMTPTLWRSTNKAFIG